MEGILILLFILDIYRWILIARVVLSFIPLFKPDWVPPSFLTPVIDVVYGLTEPPLQLLRRVVPQPAGFPFDLSFLVLFLIVGLLPQIIVAGAR
ncbi:MAG TPA: YggT family protein [Actinomycetota bacterium]|nr:YggT family protein [Actinomycetota bacterium]